MNSTTATQTPAEQYAAIRATHPEAELQLVAVIEETSPYTVGLEVVTPDDHIASIVIDGYVEFVPTEDEELDVLPTRLHGLLNDMLHPYGVDLHDAPIQHDGVGHIVHAFAEWEVDATFPGQDEMHIVNVPTSRAEVFASYGNQLREQPVWLDFDPATLEADLAHAPFSTENTSTFDIQNGVTFRWTLPRLSMLREYHLALRNDHVDGLLRRIAAGHDTKWDGSNTVGVLNDHAATAMAELDQLLDRLARQ